MTEPSTRDAVLAWRAREPDITASELARGLGVSRARIAQILALLGLPTRTAGSNRNKGATVPKSRVLTGGVAVPITHTVAGTIGELLVAADLLTRGYCVYAPVTRHQGKADLIALPRYGGKPLLIEARCGHRGEKGAVYASRERMEGIDHLAVILTGEPVVYKPELPQSPA